MSLNDLANEAYFAVAKPVPGRKPGDLGSISARPDDVVEEMLRRDPSLDREEALMAVLNID
jgi:hypothetical protein